MSWISASQQLKFLVWKWCQMNLIVFEKNFDDKIMTFLSVLQTLGHYNMK